MKDLVAWSHSLTFYWFSFYTYNTLTHSYIHEHSMRLLSIPSSSSFWSENEREISEKIVEKRKTTEKLLDQEQIWSEYERKISEIKRKNRREIVLFSSANNVRTKCILRAKYVYLWKRCKHVKGSDQWEGRGYGRSPNHYMLVGEVVFFCHFNGLPSCMKSYIYCSASKAKKNSICSK